MDKKKVENKDDLLVYCDGVQHHLLSEPKKDQPCPEGKKCLFLI